MIAQEDIQSFVNQHDVCALLFTATWCKTCGKYESFKKHEKVMVIDYGLNDDIAEEMNIKKLPTIILYKHNKPIQTLDSSLGVTEFKEFLDSK